MVIGVLTLELFIPESQSLKDKRQVLKSLLETIRQKFNVSAAEVDGLDLWQRATLGFACVSNEQVFCDQVLNKVLLTVEGNPRVEVTNVEMEFL